MKTINKNKALSFLLIVFFSLQALYSQNDCNAFYPFTEGTTLEITHYNKRDKVIDVQQLYVKNVENTTSEHIATIDIKVKNQEDEDLLKDFEVVCKDDETQIDFKSLLPAETLEQFKDIKLNMEGTNLTIPNTLTVGQTLPDATLVLQINQGGLGMKMTTSIVDRKVVGQEDITTPAGTFDCFAIVYTTKTKMGMQRTTTGKQWIARGVGMVKQEDYNKRGKIIGKSILTSFSQ